MTREEEIDELLDRYADTVYKLALCHTHSRFSAQDVFQETFLALYRNKKPFASEEHRKAWLIRVTLNFCKKYWRSAWQRHTVSLEEAPVFEQENYYEVFEAVSALPPKYRSVVHLFYYEQLTVEQISQVLHRNKNTVLSQLHRARAMLRRELGVDTEDSGKENDQ